MTLISILERRGVATQPMCDRCDRVAWAHTAEGLRCEDHAIAEFRSAVDGGGDWVPRVRRSRRSHVA